jgi:hypothetical protein
MEDSMGMHENGGTKNRGRVTDITVGEFLPAPTRPNFPIELDVEANRPIGRGGTKHRGDRADTNRQFTGNNRRQPNFGDPRGSGKKQTQGGGKGLQRAHAGDRRRD